MRALGAMYAATGALVAAFVTLSPTAADEETLTEITIRTRFHFSVYATGHWETHWLGSRYARIGSIGPERARIRVPRTGAWYLQVDDPKISDADLRSIVAEIAGAGVPGVSLFDCTKISNRGLKCLAELDTLRFLDLMGCDGIDDGAGATLGSLSLRELRLNDVAITDATVLWLSQAGTLVSLDLAGTRIGAESLRALARTGIKDLSLSGSRIDDTALKSLSGASRLAALDLGRTAVGDAGLAALKAIPNLEALSLTDTAVSDTGCREMVGMRLKYLYMNGCALSDVGLATLASLETLDVLDLQGTRVTEAGVRRFRARNPRCRVDGLDFEPGH